MHTLLMRRICPEKTLTFSWRTLCANKPVVEIIWEDRAAKSLPGFRDSGAHLETSSESERSLSGTWKAEEARSSG